MLRRRPEPTISRKVAALFAIVIALALFSLVAPLPGSGEGLSEGDVAPRDLFARKGAQFESEVRTEAARDSAAASVPDVREADPSIRSTQLADAERLFAQVRVVTARADLNLPDKVDVLGELPPASQLSSGARQRLLALSPGELADAEAEATNALDAILSGLVNEEERDGTIETYLAENDLTDSSGEPTVLGDVLRILVVPNLLVDEARTEALREAARDNVNPEIVSITEDELIVAEGEIITPQTIEELRAGGVVDDSFAEAADWAAGAIVALGAGLLLGVFLYQLQPVPAGVNRRLIVAGFVVFAALGLSRVALPFVLPDTDGRFFAYAIPVAVAAMLAASILELNFAAIIAVVVGLFAAFAASTAPEVAGSEFGSALDALQLAVVYTVGGLAGAVAVYRAERVTRYGLGGAAVFVATWAALLAFWLLEGEFDRERLGWLTAVAAANGFLSGVITVGVFILLSSAFGVTTRLRLMELAQTDHPLLARLQEEAPGTFQHSMMVGNLAERAARRIGADALTTRVGAYYHDIGKLAQPEYYIENQLDGDSPHDSLEPLESARHIMQHVDNGIALARRYRLPGLIADFIPEHHGTRLVAFFYRRAAEQEASVDRSAFRYSGPRPKSKETAIVMLADSCEAVVRASEQKETERLGELVDGVFAERLAEGQLDECDITLRDLQVVAESFKATFRAIYHPRIAYPTPQPEEIAAIARGAEPPTTADRYTGG